MGTYFYTIFTDEKGNRSIRIITSLWIHVVSPQGCCLNKFGDGSTSVKEMQAMYNDEEIEFFEVIDNWVAAEELFSEERYVELMGEYLRKHLTRLDFPYITDETPDGDYYFVS